MIWYGPHNTSNIAALMQSSTITVNYARQSYGQNDASIITALMTIIQMTEVLGEGISYKVSFQLHWLYLPRLMLCTPGTWIPVLNGCDLTHSRKLRAVSNKVEWWRKLTYVWLITWTLILSNIRCNHLTWIKLVNIMRAPKQNAHPTP